MARGDKKTSCIREQQKKGGVQVALSAAEATGAQMLKLEHVQ